jgi:hypothetical protein
MTLPSEYQFISNQNISPLEQGLKMMINRGCHCKGGMSIMDMNAGLIKILMAGAENL